MRKIRTNSFVHIYNGTTRFAIAIGSIVIKFPKFGARGYYGFDFLLMGMLGNALERKRFKKAKEYQKHQHLAEMYFCFPLGLFNVSKRYRTLLERQLTYEEKNKIPLLNIDDTYGNTAIEGTKVIILDYGNVDAHIVIDRWNDT